MCERSIRSGEFNGKHLFETKRLLKISSSKAAGRHVTENEAGGDFQQPIYRSRMAPCSTVICVTGSPEAFSSVRICSLR